MRFWVRHGALIAASFAAATPLGAASAADLTPASRIDAVTVYPDAAIVTREAEADLPAGDARLVFSDLPMSLDPASLRVEGAGATEIVIGAVDLAVAPVGKAPESGAIEAKIKALREERETLQATIDSLQIESAMIQRYAMTGREKPAPGEKLPDVEAWATAWEAVRAASAKVGEALRPALARARELDEQIKALEAARQRPDAEAARREATVSIAAAAATHATLKLSYRIAGVGWTPGYDAALDTAGEAPTLTWTRRAAIAQTTGEDWRDVALTVSTARIARSTSVADVGTARVNFIEAPIALDKASGGNAPAAPRPRMKAAAPQDEATVAARAAPQPAPESKPAVEATSQLNANGYDAEFKVAGRVTLASDGARKSFALARWTAKPTLALRSAPGFDPAAYIDARFAGADDAPILPGAVSLIRDGQFIGSDDIGFVAPGETIKLGFGADDKIKVRRSPVSRKENDPAWFNQSKVETREFKTTVKNLHARPVKVQLVDQLPVSENTSIVVDLSPVTTPATDKQVDDKRGVLGWTLDLAPGESKDVRFAYRLKWPADRDLTIDATP